MTLFLKIFQQPANALRGLGNFCSGGAIFTFKSSQKWRISKTYHLFTIHLF